MVPFNDHAVIGPLLARGGARVVTPTSVEFLAVWSVRCPIHNDRNPSLCVTVKRDGRVLMFCRSCSPRLGKDEALARILDAIGCTGADLSPHGAVTKRPTDRVLRDGRERLAANHVLIDGLEARAGFTAQALALVEVGLGKDNALVIPERDTGGRVVGAVNYAPRHLRGTTQPKYLAHGHRGLAYAPADLGQFDLWVEGPSSALAAISLGCAAIGLPSAGSWDRDWAALAAPTVTVVADSDAPGRDHADRVAQALTKAGRKARIIDLFPDREDGSDLGDLLREVGRERALQALTRAASEAPVVVARKPGRPPHRRDAAMAFIETFLTEAGAPASWAAIVTAGIDAGHKKQTLRTARDKLLVAGAIRHVVIDGRHFWAESEGNNILRPPTVVRKPIPTSATSADEHWPAGLVGNCENHAGQSATPARVRQPEREVVPGIVTINGRRPHMPDDDAPDWWQSPASGYARRMPTEEAA